MDELKLKLSTKVMRGLIAKLLSKTLSKKLGCDISISINELEVEMVNGKVHIHTNVDAETDNKAVMNIINSFDD